MNGESYLLKITKAMLEYHIDRSHIKLLDVFQCFTPTIVHLYNPSKDELFKVVAIWDYFVSDPTTLGHIRDLSSRHLMDTLFSKWSNFSKGRSHPSTPITLFDMQQAAHNHTLYVSRLLERM